MSGLSLSFREWPFPTAESNGQKHLSAWGECGLFACTSGSSLLTFSNENGHYSPMHMFSPFDGHEITAIGWSNGSSYPTKVVPLLAVASDRGRMYVYNLRTKELVGKNSFNEKINSIRWSAFDSNRLYIGTHTGYLYSCIIRNKCIEVTQEFNFGFNVDYIAEDFVDGATIAVASIDGSIGCINNIHKYKINLHIFRIQNPINYFNFFPNHPNFLLIATSQSTSLFSVHEETLVPFIQTTGARFIKIPDTADNQAIIGYDDCIALWTLENDCWTRSAPTNFVTMATQSAEILTYSQIDDKILVTTSSHWLTGIEMKRNKLFITSRIKLMDSQPNDWDFRKGSIAFGMENGSVSITSWTPDSIIKPKFDKHVVLPSVEDLSNTYYSRLSLNDWSDLEKTKADDECPINNELCGTQAEDSSFSSNFVSIPFSPHMERRNSSTDLVETDNVFQQMALVSKMNKEDSLESMTRPPAMKNLIPKKKIAKNPENIHVEALCGNSNTLLLSIHVSQNPIERVTWAPGGRIIAWSQKSLYLIDLKRRVVNELLKNNFENRDSIITNVFFTKSRTSMCVVLDGTTAIFMTTGSNPKKIGTMNFNNKHHPIIGSFSPKEDQAILASGHTIYILKFNQCSVSLDFKRSLKKEIIGEISFISWKNGKIIIGTDLGSVFSTNLEYDNFNLIHQGDAPITFVSPCSNKSHVIVDSQNKALVISCGVEQPIKGRVETLRLANSYTFLVKFAGASKLSAVAAIGQFSPLPPPCLSRCPLMLDAQRYSRELKNQKITSFSQAVNSARLFGSAFIQQLLVAKEKPNILRNNIALLYKVVSFHSLFNSWAIRIALKIGELNAARELLLGTDPSVPDYVNKMSLAALFDTKLPGESIQLAVNGLINNKKYVEATDIMLITLGPKETVETLLKFGRIRDACMILMLQKEKDRDLELVLKVSKALLEDDAILLALKLLSTCGLKQDMLQLTTKIVGPELSHVLEWLD